MATRPQSAAVICRWLKLYSKCTCHVTFIRRWRRSYIYSACVVSYVLPSLRCRTPLGLIIYRHSHQHSCMRVPVQVNTLIQSDHESVASHSPRPPLCLVHDW